jgi:hypothetical protein
MHERRTTIERSRQNAEDQIDTLLASGELLDAATILDASVDEGYGPADFPHLVFKACALPLYELAYHPPTEERIRSANDTYGFCADLISRELAIYNSDELCPTTRDKYRHLGRISELTIFSLLIRDGVSKNVAAVPVPASRRDDTRKNIDFYLSPVGTGKIDDGWKIQAKTFTQDTDKSDSNDDIVIISMEEIDPYVRTPNDLRSLHQCIFRELNGSASDDDIARLEATTGYLYEKITGNEKTRGTRGRDWTIRRMVDKVLRAARIKTPEQIVKK